MTILAAVGEEERSDGAVTVAYDLATTYGDPLVVLHVVPEEEFETHKEEVESIPGFRDFSLSQEEQSAAQFVSRIVDQVLDGGDRDVIETRGRVGDPAEGILAEAEAVDPRYLVIGGRRRSPVGKAIFGSTTQQDLLNADWPVVTTMADRSP